MIELEQYQTDVANVRQQILTAGEALQVGHMREQIDELSEEMNQPEFWNDLERSTKVNQKLGHLKNRLNHYEKLLSTADDIEVMISLAKEENDESMVQEVGTELQKLKEQADALELETLMRGDYDDCDAILSLHAGAGGTEAQDWTQMLYRMYTRYCEKMGYSGEAAGPAGRGRGGHQVCLLPGERRPCLWLFAGGKGRAPAGAHQSL